MFNIYEIKKTFFDNIKLGDHICSIYNDKKQQFSVIVPFFKAGLNNNQKCIYITEENSKKEVLLELKNGGIDVNKYAKLNQLVILTKEDTYLKDGSFNPGKMIELWKETEKNAVKEGFSGARVTGEASCMCKNEEESNKLMDYEAQLNGVFPHTKIIALCQYNENKLKPKVLMEAIHTHPLLVIYGNPHQNMYFSPCTSIDAEHKLPFDFYTLIRDSIIKEN